MNESSALRTVLATLGFLLVAAFFLQTEHRAHLFGILPFAFLLACPLLHLLGHGGRREPPEDRRARDWRSRSEHSGHHHPAGGSP